MDQEQTDNQQPLNLNEHLAEPVAIKLSEIQQNLLATVERIHTERTAFEQRVYEDWRPALDLYDVTIDFMLRAVHQLNTKHGPQYAENNDLLFIVLLQLQARACLTASEIGALLRTGHSDAAYTRWRTLHELAIVAKLLRQHNNLELTERYIAHEWIEAERAAIEHQEHCSVYGQAPFDSAVMEQLRLRREHLCARYGASFRKPYGWAATVVSNPNISTIEQAVGKQARRTIYRTASQSVHPNAFGLRHITNSQKRLLLSGPSNSNLLMPAISTLDTLLDCTSSLFLYIEDEEVWTNLIALGHLCEQTTLALIACHRRLEDGIIQWKAPGETDFRQQDVETD